MTKAKVGRPAIGAAPMTGAERMRRVRELAAKREQDRLRHTIELSKEILSEPGGTPIEIVLPPFVTETIKRFQIVAALTAEQIIQGALVTWAIEESEKFPSPNQGWRAVDPSDTETATGEPND